MIYCFRTRDNWFCSPKKKLSKSAQIFFGRVSENFPNFSFFGARFCFVFFILFFLRSPEAKFCVNRSAKTVNDRKISKTDLDSCDTEVPPIDKNGGVTRAICSQEHLPSFLFFGHYAKTVWDKKIQKIFFDSCGNRLLSDTVLDNVAWAICSQEHLI